MEAVLTTRATKYLGKFLAPLWIFFLLAAIGTQVAARQAIENGLPASFPQYVRAEEILQEPKSAVPVATRYAAERIIHDHLPCTLIQAANRSFEGILLVEISCKEGLGFMLIGSPVVGATDCVTAQGNPNRCRLDENKNPELALLPYIKNAGIDCYPLKARPIAGLNKESLSRFEIKCANGGGYILDVPYGMMDGSGPWVKGTIPAVYNCLQASFLCKSTSHMESVVNLKRKLMPSLDSSCEIIDVRFVGHVEEKGSDFYELSCSQNHKGILVELDKTEALLRKVPCEDSTVFGAACEMTTPRSRNSNYP